MLISDFGTETKFAVQNFVSVPKSLISISNEYRSIPHRITRPPRVGAGHHCAGFWIDPDGLHVTEAAPAGQDAHFMSHGFQRLNGFRRCSIFDLDFNRRTRLVEVR